MKNICRLFILALLLQLSLYAQKINILYDTQNDGTIYPDSIWIVNLIKEAGDNLDIEINFEGAPWNRALKLLKSGIADGLINASYTKERAQYAAYPLKNGQPDSSKSLKSPSYHLYKRIDNDLKFDGKKLINAKGSIGAIKSYAVVDNLKKLNANIEYGINAASNLQNVLHKKLLATAQLAKEADSIINNNPQMKRELKKLPIPIRKKEYYLIISKPYYENNSLLVAQLWDEIEKLKNKKIVAEQGK